jgi:hypothetical protein
VRSRHTSAERFDYSPQQLGVKSASFIGVDVAILPFWNVIEALARAPLGLEPTTAAVHQLKSKNGT